MWSPFVVFLVTYATLVSSSIDDTDPDDQGTRTNAILVTLSKDSTDSDLNDILQRHPEFSLTGQLNLPDKIVYQLTFDRSKAPLQMQSGDTDTHSLSEDSIFVDRMRIEDKVASIKVEEKKKYFLYQAGNDPELNSIWYLAKGDKQSLRYRYNHNIQEAIAAGYTGKNVTIGIVDGAIQFNHTDLTNIVANSSYDYLNGDDDPMPVSDSDSHGTVVSGIIGATKGNNFCQVGVAYDATLFAIALIAVDGAALTDLQVNQAMGHNGEEVDIYCNSWGPGSSSGFYTQDQTSVDSYISTGRGGKGTIYVFAAGNSGFNSNSNSFSITASIYTITVGSVDGKSVSRYTSYGTNVMTSGYGGGYQDKLTISTKPFDGCSGEQFQGTSFSAPIIVGIIGLGLEANPLLTWRDVQHLVVRSSVAYRFTDNFDRTRFVRNKRGYRHSPKLGFGILDAKKFVDNAKTWTLVDPMITCTSSSNTPTRNSTLSRSATGIINLPRTGCDARFLENVEVYVDYSYSGFRGTVEFTLISPSGTKAVFNNVRTSDATINYQPGTHQWTWRVVSFWGERALGRWRLLYKSVNRNEEVSINSWYVKVHGTSKYPKGRARG